MMTLLRVSWKEENHAFRVRDRLESGVLVRRRHGPRQQAPTPAKLAPTTPAVNKSTCEQSVAKIGTPARAATTAGPFAAMDVNKDGKIDPTEFKGPKKAFAWIDTDHDGYIARPEATRAYLTIVGRMAIEQRKSAFKAMDENKDGKVSLSEYRGPTRAFARIDVNHDGVITPEEAKHAFQASVDHFVVAIRFKALDTNHDGKISAAEFKGPKAAFDKYSDKNGLIGPAAYARLVQERTAAWIKLATAQPVPTPAKPVAAVTKTNVVTAVKATTTPKTKTNVVKQVKTTFALTPVTPAARVSMLNRILAMDTNKDGKVSMGEYFKAVEARFVFLDQDKDGYITASDLTKVAALRQTKATSTPVVATPAKAPIKPVAAVTKTSIVKPVKKTSATKAVTPAANVSGLNRILAMDTNKDGKVGMREYITAVEARFAFLDQDKDGYITACDLAKVAALRNPKAKATSTPVAATPAKTPVKPVAVVTKTNIVKRVKATSTQKPAPPAAHAGGLNRILAMDANKDGKVGMGEYFKAVEARFVWLDQDKDGYITASDLTKVAALRKTKGTSTPVAAAPAKTPVKPATLKPAKPAAVKPGKTASKPLAAANEVLPSKIDVSFDQIDVNHDGVLSRTEIKVYLAKQSHKVSTTTVSHRKG